MRPLASVVALSCLSLPGVARAESCDALVSELAAFTTLSAIPSTYGWYVPVVAFTLVGNRRSQDWAEYTTGELRYVVGNSPAYQFTDYHRIAGHADQLFSDRLFWGTDWWGDTCWGCGFAPDAADSLGVAFAADTRAGADYGDVRLTWESWGSPSTVLETECRGDYLYAFNGADEMLVFTFEPRWRWCGGWDC